MNTKFNIQLFNGITSAGEAVILAAAKCNGGQAKLNLEQLKSLGDGLKLPDEKTTFEIIGDDRLHIDTKVNGSYETVGIIELVEVYDLEETGTILSETDTFTTSNNIL